MSVVKDLFSRLFWDSAEPPSAQAIADKLAEIRARLAQEEEMRAFNAAERQRLAAVFTREEFATADRLEADSKNAIEGYRAQIAVLEAEHATAAERERRAELDHRKAAAITEAWRRQECAVDAEPLPDDVVESFARVALQALDQRGELR